MNRVARRWRNSDRRYGWIAMALHWTVAALLGWQLWLGLSAADLSIGIERLKLLGRHKSLGFVILVLMLLRLSWRWWTPPPAPPPGPRWQTTAAKLSHGLLYLLLIIMPLIGWASSSAAHLTISVFGWFQLPDLLAPNRSLAHQLVEWHETLAWMLMAVLLVHIAAALWHQLWRRDTVLRRMLPFTRIPPEESTE